MVTRYRINLEQAHYASSTINLRLAAIRRLAYEAADCGLLGPDLAAGIRRVKGVKKHGMHIGNWLTADQGKRLLQRSAVRICDPSFLQADICVTSTYPLAGSPVQRGIDLQQRRSPKALPRRQSSLRWKLFRLLTVRSVLQFLE